MTKYLMLLLVLGLFAAPNLGCEAEADDDGASIKVDGD
jgi:hypothetical protein